MTVTVKVICDSISDAGVRLTTMQLRYPRMIHADFMTHRVFSRNGRSSRAVPFSVLVKEEPYIPTFMKNQPGMVASEKFDYTEFNMAADIWLEAARHCQAAAQKLADIGVHKQWVNRMLEWFGYIDVLVTSTDWSNFFELRRDGGAQPEIIELADAMYDALNDSTPARCSIGAWHLPYVDIIAEAAGVNKWLDANQPGWDNDISLHDAGEIVYDVLKKISVARCARLTIKPFDGDGSIDKEIARYEKLMVSRPVHASPAEHIATPDELVWDICETSSGVFYKTVKKVWNSPQEHGNFYGWRQFRKMIPDNTIYDR